MLTIGFANEFYTLWDVSEPYKVYIDAHRWYEKTDFTYIRNLSKTLEGAKAKMSGEYRIDEELKGSSNFSRESKVYENFENYQFTFGQFEGADIRTCNNVWQIQRAYESGRGGRRRVYARKRLIELGELVKYIPETIYDVVTDGCVINKLKKHFYITPEEMKRLEVQKAVKADNDINNGHYFNDGDKVELIVREESKFWFKTAYGESCVVIYRESATNRIFKYFGSAPAFPRDVNGDTVFDCSSLTIKGNYTHLHAKSLIFWLTRLKETFYGFFGALCLSACLTDAFTMSKKLPFTFKGFSYSPRFFFGVTFFIAFAIVQR